MVARCLQRTSGGSGVWDVRCHSGVGEVGVVLLGYGGRRCADVCRGCERIEELRYRRRRVLGW